MWVRAVWMEKEKEIEDVVPDIWVKGDYVFWPPVANAEKAMKCRQQPTSSWRQFKLIKIKCRSESHKDCEDYDVTTTIEESSSEDEEMAGVKRKPKKKQFSDYVTAETSEVTTDVNQDMPAVTITQEPTRSTEISLPRPPVKVAVPPTKQDCSGKAKLDSRRLQQSLPVDSNARSYSNTERSHRSRSPLSRDSPSEGYGDRGRSPSRSHRESRKSRSHCSRHSESNESQSRGSRDSHRSPTGSQRDRRRSGSDMSGDSHRSSPGSQKSNHRSGSQRDSHKSLFDRSQYSGSNTSQSRESRDSHRSPAGSQRDRRRSGSDMSGDSHRSTHRSRSQKESQKSLSDRSRGSGSGKGQSEGYRDNHKSRSKGSRDSCRSLSRSQREGDRSGSEMSRGSRSRSRSQQFQDFTRSLSASLSERSRSGDRNSCRSQSRQSRGSHRSGSHKSCHSYDSRRSNVSQESRGLASGMANDRLSLETPRSPDFTMFGSYRRGALQPRDSVQGSTSKQLSSNHRSHLTSTPRTEKKEAFPMSEAKFQKKALHLLVEIRNELSDLKGSRQEQPNTEADSYISQSETLDDFAMLENSIKIPEERRRLVKKLKQVGGLNVKDNVKRIMEKLMSNELMSKFNMKGNRQKMSFEKTGLLKVVQASAMLTFVTTEQDVNVAVAVCLKYAPDRRGGTGRRTVGMINQLREPLEHERDDDINFRL